MIIQNGTIEVKSVVSGGIDPETGYPLPSGGGTWGAPIPCQFLADTYNRQAISNGERYTESHFTILIEEPQSRERIERIRLKDLFGDVVGEYSVKQVEPLEGVCEVKIIV